LDTAGRYVTQDSHQEVDEKEWQGFLELLKEYRPKRPLNGILVAQGLYELLSEPEEKTRQYASDLRRRVLELYNAMGIRVPIYMLFTKVDRVAGFNDFFSDFGLDERKQVWGETFPSDELTQPQNWLSAFDTAYDELMLRLDPHVYKGIQEDRNSIQRRSLILMFPQQMALLKPAIIAFLETVFSEDDYEKTPLLLRGVYFACGTQKGNPVDRLMGIYAKAFSLGSLSDKEFKGQGKSFFLNRLLKDVMFPEAELAGIDSRIKRRESLLQWGVWVGALMLLLGMVGLWSISYSQNRAAMVQTEEQIKLYHEANETPVDTRANFKLLQQKLDALLEARNIWRNMGWLAHLGLYQGNKLGLSAEEVYKQHLHDYFLSSILIRLQERLNTESNITLLKTYRMFGKPDWAKFDPKTITEVMVADWVQLFNADEAALTSLRVHLKNLLDLKREDELAWRLKPVDLESKVIADAILVLTKDKPYQRCYNSFKSLKSDTAHDFRLVEHLIPNGQKVFITSDGKDISTMPAIPSLFTAWGYREFVLVKSAAFVHECMADSWVLDEPSSQSDFQRLYEQFMVLYTDEYGSKWWGLLRDLKLAPTKNLRETAEQLDILSRQDSSPLRLLLTSIEQNTALGGTSDAVMKVADKMNSNKLTQASDLIKTTQQIPGVDVGAITGKQVEQMEKSFAQLNRLVHTTPDNKSVPLDSVLEKAKDLGNYFLGNSNRDQAQQSAVIHTSGGGDVVEQSKREFQSLPEPANRWLLSLNKGGIGETMSNAKQALSDKARSAGISGSGTACGAAFTGRYPFVQSSSTDAPLSDFIRFFAPNGILDQFFQQNLKGFVDTGATIPSASSSLGLSKNTIHQFQSAAKIRDAFFPTGAQNPDVQFDLKLVDLSPDVESFRFNNEGQEVVFRKGQVETARIHWTGLTSGAGVQFIFETSNKRHIQSLKKTGSWALLRTLEESSLQRDGGQDLFSVNFQAGGLSARFKLQALSMNNPFSLGDARNFYCPEKF
jgi:type VI secretion system protein ImpL